MAHSAERRAYDTDNQQLITYNRALHARLCLTFALSVNCSPFTIHLSRSGRRTEHFYMDPRSLGSRASLRPSPTMLKAKTTSMIARPGAKDNTGVVSRYRYPSLTIAPQAAPGGAIPTPRKLSAASAKMADPIIMVIKTMRGGKQLGATCLSMTLELLAPMARPAMT